MLQEYNKIVSLDALKTQTKGVALDISAHQMCRQTSCKKTEPLQYRTGRQGPRHSKRIDYKFLKNIFKELKKNVGMTGIKSNETRNIYRDVSDDSCDVACDHLVIQHYRFTSSLYPTCNVIFVH